MSAGWLAAVADEDFSYLTTRGRRTGNPHTIEIWFGVHDGVVYMMAGGRTHADWVRNVMRTPEVQVAFGRRDAPVHTGRARVLDPVDDADADALARRLLAAKYDEWEPGQAGRVLSGWARTALPVEIRFAE